MDNGAFGFFLFFFIIIIIWILAMRGCVSERSRFGVYEGLENKKFSGINGDSCYEVEVSGDLENITQDNFNNINSVFKAEMKSCPDRGYKKIKNKTKPQSKNLLGYDILFDGIEWQQ